jgi:signal transduction histidine kinase
MALRHVETAETLERLRLEVDELRASRRRLALADDGERRSLERELHDGVQQRLVALAVNIQLAQELVGRDPEAAAELLDAMGSDVQRALDEAAGLAQRIYPPLLEIGGLGAALRAAAVGANVPTEITVSAAELSREAAAAVYHCWLNALEGTSDGRTPSIRVESNAEAVTFEIEAALSAEVLSRMRDRVEAIDGRLVIGSRADGSTTLRGSLPGPR